MKVQKPKARVTAARRQSQKGDEKDSGKEVRPDSKGKKGDEKDSGKEARPDSEMPISLVCDVMLCCV